MSSNPSKPRLRARVALLGVAGALLALPATAEPPAPGPERRPPPGPPPLEHVLERLDLDGARLDALYAIVDSARGERRRLRRQLRGAHERMRELLAEDAPDRAETLALVETIGGYELEMHRLDITTLLDVRARLEPAERAELDRAMAPPPRHEGPADLAHRGCDRRARGGPRLPPRTDAAPRGEARSDEVAPLADRG